MNVKNAIKYMTDKDPETGDYKIPYIIYSDAFYSETVPYADLILPDTTYLERWDAISMLDRPIGTAEAAADSIRQPVIEPDRDVRPFQDVVLDLGARLGLPGMVDDGGNPLYPGGYSDYLTNHERAPGVGPLSGWRGEDGESHGKGAPNKNQLQNILIMVVTGNLSLKRRSNIIVSPIRLILRRQQKWAGWDHQILSCSMSIMKCYKNSILQPKVR